MGAVFRYCAEDEPIPRWLEITFNVATYGAEAVFGRALKWNEIILMNAARSTFEAYQGRENYRDKTGKPNWSEWASLFPTLADILEEAMTYAK